MEKTLKTIVTHDGKFHTDEVLACYLLEKYLTNLGKQCKIIRTRDENVVASADFLIDIGKTYDPKNGKFDHHQQDFNETFCFGDIPMSSTGLIFKNFGSRIIESSLLNKFDFESEDISQIFSKIYYKIVREVDAIDNGIFAIYSEKTRYQYSTTLSQIISSYNCVDVYSDEQEQAFHSAKEYAKMVFDQILDSTIINYFQYRIDYKIICDAYKNAICENQIIIVEKDCPQYLKCIFDYEKKHFNSEKITKFVVYRLNGKYRIKAIPIQIGSFKNRKYLLEKDEYEFKEDIIFVHKGKFIGASNSREICVKMGKQSLGIEI